MKVAALFAVEDQFPELDLRLIHTGQHYDSRMSDVFFYDLGLPDPVRHFDVGSASHAVQTAAIMTSYEDSINQHPPDLCVVVGDVNSTVACAVVAAKAGIPIAHIEAGLRSGDKTMPEEINRLLTDSISDLLFASEPDAVVNLAREGRAADSIHLVGQVMVDTLLRTIPQAADLEVWKTFGVDAHDYSLVTLHRPANVDDRAQLEKICEELIWLSERLPIIFPIHPRTLANLEQFGLHDLLANQPDIHLTEPVSYLHSLSLMSAANLVVTDSGGLQEETTAIGVPCLTLRDNTERPITVTEGSNHLIRGEWQQFRTLADDSLSANLPHQPCQVPYWDGKSGKRIMRICSQYLTGKTSGE